MKNQWRSNLLLAVLMLASYFSSSANAANIHKCVTEGGRIVFSQSACKTETSPATLIAQAILAAQYQDRPVDSDDLKECWKAAGILYRNLSRIEQLAYQHILSRKLDPTDPGISISRTNKKLHQSIKSLLHDIVNQNENLMQIPNINRVREAVDTELVGLLNDAGRSSEYVNAIANAYRQMHRNPLFVIISYSVMEELKIRSKQNSYVYSSSPFSFDQLNVAEGSKDKHDGEWWNRQDKTFRAMMIITLIDRLQIEDALKSSINPTDILDQMNKYFAYQDPERLTMDTIAVFYFLLTQGRYL